MPPSRLIANIERHTTATASVSPQALGAFEAWCAGRAVVCALHDVVPRAAGRAQAFARGLGLRRTPLQGLDVLRGADLFATVDANACVTYATSFAAACEALRHGFTSPESLRPRRRVVRALNVTADPPLAHGTTADARWSLASVRDGRGAIVGVGSEALRRGLSSSCVVIGLDTALADPSLCDEPLSARGRIHAQHHLHRLDRRDEEAPTAEVLRASIAADDDAQREGLIAAFLGLYARFGHLASDREGQLVWPFGERPYEVWRPDAYATEADQTAAGGCDRLMMLRWCESFRSPETLAFLDGRGRFWGYHWGRETFFLLADCAEVWIERLVRAKTVLWSPRVGRARSPDARAEARVGEVWAAEHGCALVPEASDTAARLWESDDTVIVEDASEGSTARWTLGL